MANESDLPPLDPAMVQLPDFNSASELMKWLIGTVLEMDEVTDERREQLALVISQMQFNEIMKDVSADIIKDLTATQMEKLLEELDPNEGEPTE